MEPVGLVNNGAPLRLTKHPKYSSSMLACAQVLRTATTHGSPADHRLADLHQWIGFELVVPSWKPAAFDRANENAENLSNTARFGVPVTAMMRSPACLFDGGVTGGPVD